MLDLPLLNLLSPEKDNGDFRVTTISEVLERKFLFFTERRGHRINRKYFVPHSGRNVGTPISKGARQRCYLNVNIKQKNVEVLESER